MLRRYQDDVDFVSKVNFDNNYRKTLDEMMNKIYESDTIKLIKEITLIKNLKNEDLQYIKEVDSFKTKKNTYDNRSQFCNLIQSMFREREKEIFIDRQMLYVILIFKLVETYIGSEFYNSNKNFKKVLEGKVKHFQNIFQINRFSSEKEKNFIEYFKRRYETGKRYIVIEQNKKYYKNLMKTVLFSSYVLINLLHKVRKRGRCVIC